MIAAKLVQQRAYVAGARDSHGNPTPSWSAAKAVQVFGWAPASADSENLDSNRTATIRDLDVYAPIGVTTDPRDKWVVGGVEYEAIGHEEDFTNGPFGYMPGVRVSLQRVEG